jgi:phosphoribosyl 1,2-cyclic phosphodiesterase
LSGGFSSTPKGYVAREYHRADGCGQYSRVKIIVLGARGSTPAPWRDFLRYGGHTSSLALAHDGAAPRLVIDAGTGIRTLSALLDGPFHGGILLGHLHWDHIQGLPFFRAGDNPEARVALYGPHQGPETDLGLVLGRAMSPPHFPITPGELRGTWSFENLSPGEHQIEDFSVLALDIPHKGGRSFGYRISDGRVTLAYLSDHWPTGLGPGPAGLGEYHENAVRLVSGADIVFHDAQYTDEELPARGYFGHSCPSYALGLAMATGAKRLVLFHHDPQRTDDEIDAIVAGYQDAAIAVEAAIEGAVIELLPS